MVNFEDYHRTVIGYHGTKRSAASEIVLGNSAFEPSRNAGDWLGSGIYFWEHAPQRALRWAVDRENSDREDWKGEQAAVLGSMIRLGYCLDLLDPDNILVLKQFHRELDLARQAANRPLPVNVRHARYLDCAVFNAIFVALAEQGKPLDSVRAVYSPVSGRRRIWRGCWISEDSHVQVCVLNPKCILGTWLVHPSSAGGSDGRTARTDESTGRADSALGIESRPSGGG